MDVPHDWNIGAIPDPKNPTGAGGGYLSAGVGWYRKSSTPASGWKGKQVSIEFDGIASDATVYLNGNKLGFHPYAYTSFRFYLTQDLDFSKPNVLAVRVDNSQQPSSRWYTGSGIYRHVRMVVTEPLHVAPWGSLSAHRRDDRKRKRAHPHRVAKGFGGFKQSHSENNAALIWGGVRKRTIEYAKVNLVFGGS